jgi:ribosomal protein L11 methyltransferase
MMELFPEGFEEVEESGSVELAAFTDEAGAERVRAGLGRITVEPVAAGWEDEWKRFHRPVEVGLLWIGPPWVPVPRGPIPVVIEPGRAFGTGAHPTTQLSLELLQDLEPGPLLDVGCGSGVVAIAARKLGFGPVLAVDVDEAAVDATRGNAVANGVDLDVRLLDARAEPLPEARIAVANIDLATVAALTVPASFRRIVVSGYYALDEPAFDGFERVTRLVRDGWAADLFARE